MGTQCLILKSNFRLLFCQSENFWVAVLGVMVYFLVFLKYTVSVGDETAALGQGGRERTAACDPLWVPLVALEVAVWEGNWIFFFKRKSFAK